jgi:hypothetical protein
MSEALNEIGAASTSTFGRSPAAVHPFGGSNGCVGIPARA